MAMESIATRIPSTGQTLGDLYDLAYLFKLVNLTDSPYNKEGWIPPAVLDPAYRPPIRDQIPVIIGSSIALAIVTLLVLVKILTTQLERKSWNLFLEDWLLLFSVLSAIATVTLTSYCMHYQAGWHVYDVRMHNVIALYKATSKAFGHWAS
ncbi:hypothetical protein ABW19_dt0201947 [Dactylella cylindrospora]|nr:hypothetical protein ABW19_dt0201947 [Dactylella cylindrospora]